MTILVFTVIVKELANRFRESRKKGDSIATEENKAVVRHVLEELFNQGNLQLVDEILGKLAREGAKRGVQELEEKGVYLPRPVLRNPMARVREALEA